MDLAPTTLNGWYKLVNSIYLERNFFRSIDSIFGHLVEVSGGLSTVLTRQWKMSDNTETFLAKSIGWWLALCGKIGVPNVEEMLWRKFPYVCSYCRENPHNAMKCRRPTLGTDEINWRSLKEIGNNNKENKPSALKEWQEMFAHLYANDDSSEVLKIFGRIQQELGEMAEAVRLVPVSHAYFMNEAVDVFAWIMRLANFEEMNRRDPGDIGVTLERAMWDEYPGSCKYCRSKPCKCPPILTTSLGRISREVPQTAFNSDRATNILSFEEQIEVFRLGEKSITYGSNSVPLSLELLQQISHDTQELRIYLKHKGDSIGQPGEVVEKLDDALEYLANIVTQQELTLQTVKEALKEISPGGRKAFIDLLIDFLTNVSSSLWVKILLHFLQTGV